MTPVFGPVLSALLLEEKILERKNVAMLALVCRHLTGQPGRKASNGCRLKLKTGIFR